MAEKLVCDQCGQTYTDQGTIDMAKKMSDQWADICKAEGVEPRGLYPCPNITCRGELILEEDQENG